VLQSDEATAYGREKTKVAWNSRLGFGLPQGPSFTFVTELIACDPGISAECATVFRGNDPVFADHFPGNPLVPGVIITEALAQTAGIAAAAGQREKARPSFCFRRFEI
jgi:3-hydroxymyristoyl/3-hydroxydecanoyl-(acyl carrier protein) dehydratase